MSACAPHRRRAVATAAATLLLLLPLAGCGGEDAPADEPTTGTSSPQSSDGGGEATPTDDQAALTPQQRIQGFFAADQQAAADGWRDLSYLDEYLTPELAAETRPGMEQNAASGASIQGEIRLDRFRVVDLTETESSIEFCEDATGLTATKDGAPAPLANAATEPSVARYTLVRESPREPWRISVRGYYEKGTTCDAHFAA